MKRRSMAALVGTLGLVALFAAPAPAFGDAKGDRGQFGARLNGYQETPAISTQADGEFRARLRDSNTIEFELRYADLEGGDATAAHIHLGQRGVAGGVVAFLCGGGGKPNCPTGRSATVTGTIVANDIQALPAQGIAGPSDFQEVVRAMRAGVTYVNVHDATYPNGEIRGQIRGGNGVDDRGRNGDKDKDGKGNKGKGRKDD